MMDNAASTTATDNQPLASSSQNGHDDKTSPGTYQQSSSADHDDTASTEKRVHRCAGCHEPHASHGWGIPGPYCEGQAKTIPPSSPPARTVAVHLADDAIDDSDRESDVIPDAAENGLASSQKSIGFSSLAAEKQALELQLKKLAIEEKELESLAILRQKLHAKEANVMQLRQAAASFSLSSQQQQQQQQSSMPSNLPSSDGLAKQFPLKTLRQQQKPAAPPLQNLLSTATPSATAGAPLPGLSWQQLSMLPQLLPLSDSQWGFLPP